MEKLRKEVTIHSGKYTSPYNIKKNNSIYEVEEIVLYDEVPKKDIHIKRGWLEDADLKSGKRRLRSVTLPTEEILLRRKKKYDGAVFIVSNGRGWAGELLCSLYIPQKMIGLEKKSRELSSFNMVVDLYRSTLLEIDIEFYRHDLKINKDLNKIENNFLEKREDLASKINRLNINKVKKDDKEIIAIKEELKELVALVDDFKKERERVEAIDLNSLD